MIRQEHGIYIASCDKCGRTINTGLKSMQQAANYLSRAEGWDSWRKRGEAWRNFCPDCVVDGDPDSVSTILAFTSAENRAWTTNIQTETLPALTLYSRPSAGPITGAMGSVSGIIPKITSCG
jgi:hypothetical protein